MWSTIKSFIHSYSSLLTKSYYDQSHCTNTIPWDHHPVGTSGRYTLADSHSKNTEIDGGRTSVQGGKMNDICTKVMEQNYCLSREGGRTELFLRREVRKTFICLRGLVSVQLRQSHKVNFVYSSGLVKPSTSHTH